MAKLNQDDMDKFPYKPGDVLSNGTKILAVIRGNVNDSFAGYRCRVILGLNKQGHRVYGDNEIIVPDSAGLADPKYFPGGTGLEIIKQLPQPSAARVYYWIKGESEMACCSLDEFMEMQKEDEKPVTPEETVSNKICKGKTKAGEPCKRFAVEGEEYCSAHME